MRARALAILLAIGGCSEAVARELPAEIAAAERARVAAVVDGSTFTLADGRTIRLAGLDIPAPGDRSGRRRTVAEAARDALAALIGTSDVAIAPVDRAIDRYGRVRAQVADAQGRWVQAEMVAGGHARVTILAEDGPGLIPLLALEAEARAARRGVWALPEFRVIAADEAARHLDSFQLVEGRVRSVERKAGRTFLNFGEDWRSDFTVEIGGAARKRFAGAGLDPARYQGKMVRVRGWIKSRNGPLIELARPEQIEVMAE